MSISAVVKDPVIVQLCCRHLIDPNDLTCHLNHALQFDVISNALVQANRPKDGALCRTYEGYDIDTDIDSFFSSDWLAGKLRH